MADSKTASRSREAPRKWQGNQPRRAAMKARARGLKAEERASKNRAEGERDLLAAIDAIKERIAASAKRLHAIVTASAPALWPKTWYGMPADASDGKVVWSFKSARVQLRNPTIGIEEAANLDEGAMWPTSSR